VCIYLVYNRVSLYYLGLYLIVYNCIFLCIYIYTPRASKTKNNCRPSMTQSKKLVFSRNRVFVKNPYFVFCWACTNLAKSGEPVSNFSFTTCSNFILTSSEIWQTEHTIETKANVIAHTRCAHSPPAAFTSYAANFPFRWTGGSQQVTMGTHGISKSAFP
jgi:hypothetical protein